MELDYEIGIPCVVQWSLLWFSAPTRWNKILGHDLKITKYHEVVNMAIMDAISRPFGGEHTEIVHVGICGQSAKQNTQKVGSEQGDGKMDDEREF